MTDKVIKKIKEEEKKIGKFVYIFFVREWEIENLDLKLDLHDFNEYAISEGDPLYEMVEQGYYVYAATFSEFIAKKFIEFRKQDKFVIKIYPSKMINIPGKNIMSSDFHDFLIMYTELTTSKRNYEDGRNSEYSTFDILITNHENTYIGMYPEASDDDVVAHERFLRVTNISCKCMNKKFLNLLGKVGFVEVMKYANWITFNTEEMNKFSIMVDELVIFMKRYYEVLELKG